MLETVELNSLKCLNVFCQMYEKNPISKNQSDVELFHRRYGLSFWPLNERPQETALHVLASKFTSTQAMNVLKDSKFLKDFSDVPDSHGSTPLLLAIKCSNMEVVRRLLPAKPDINKRNRHNEYPIYVAALNDHADVLSEILETCKYYFFVITCILPNMNFDYVASPLWRIRTSNIKIALCIDKRYSMIDVSCIVSCMVWPN
jgi:hypothetical protein